MGRKEVKTAVTKPIYLELLKQRGLELEGTYSTNARIEHRCLTCSSIFLSRRAPIIAGRGCPICENRLLPTTRSRHTEDSFKKALQAKFDLKLKRDSFSALGKKAVFKCVEHGIFEHGAGQVLKSGCPACKKKATGQARTLDRSVWEQRILDKHENNVRLLGQYLGVGNNRKYRFKCYTCFNSWKAQLPSVAITGTGCPHCANQKKSKAGFRVKEYERDGVVFRVQGWEYQAIAWLLDKKKNLKAADILTESSSRIPVIRYKFGRRRRNYYPDLFIPKSNHLIEVKSSYTLGLTSTSRSSRKMWRQNQAKAKAALEAGYKFVMMVMNKNGSRYRLPHDWYNMTAEAVLLFVAMGNGNAIPEGVARTVSTLNSASMDRLACEVATESKKHKK